MQWVALILRPHDVLSLFTTTPLQFRNSRCMHASARALSQISTKAW